MTIKGLVVAATCALSASAAKAAVQLDQASVPAGVASGFTGGYALPVGDRLEQTFVAGLTGALEAVDLALDFNVFMPEDAGFGFTLLSEAGETLWTQRLDVAASYRISDGLFRLDLAPANLRVAAGDVYRLQLSGDPGLTLSWLTRAGSSYADGAATIVGPGGARATGEDFGFRTYVQPAAAVPEPAAWALMLLGFGGLGVLARRRRASSAAA